MTSCLRELAGQIQIRSRVGEVNTAVRTDGRRCGERRRRPHEGRRDRPPRHRRPRRHLPVVHPRERRDPSGRARRVLILRAPRTLGKQRGGRRALAHVQQRGARVVGRDAGRRRSVRHRHVQGLRRVRQLSRLALRHDVAGVQRSAEIERGMVRPGLPVAVHHPR